MPTARFALDEQNMQPLLINLPDPLILTDAAGDVLWCNPAATKLFRGIKRGQNAAAVLNLDLVAEAFEACKHEKEPVEIDIKWGGLRRRYLNMRFLAFHSADGTGLQVLWTVRDLTQQRQLDKTRTDFVAAASHELRTPLASIVGFVETLQTSAKDDPAAREQFLTIMADQARRMSRLIDDLLSLSKIEMNEFEDPDTLVLISDVLDPVTNSLAIQAAERNMQIEVAGNLARTILADKDQLGQVFTNLIENSLKYAYAGTSVVIKVEEADGMVSIAVEDQSDGIPEKHLARLTERFYRVDKARSREIGGTGLGLAIVKHIIHRHSGRLNISSKKEVGSRFQVLLPLPELDPGAISERTS